MWEIYYCYYCSYTCTSSKHGSHGKCGRIPQKCQPVFFSYSYISFAGIKTHLVKFFKPSVLVKNHSFIGRLTFEIFTQPNANVTKLAPNHKCMTNATEGNSEHTSSTLWEINQRKLTFQADGLSLFFLSIWLRIFKSSLWTHPAFIIIRFPIYVSFSSSS